MGGYAFLTGICQRTNEYFLIMDRAFFPYGNKMPDFLIKRTIFLCWYLVQKGVDYIVLACNTLSALALEEVKKYFKTPILGVIQLFDFDKYHNALFIGTENTINYLKPKYPNITFIALSNLIEYIEKGQEIQLKNYLKEKRNLFDSYQYILLGCTHFIKIKHLFKNYISQDELFNIKMLNGISNT